MAVVIDGIDGVGRAILTYMGARSPSKGGSVAAGAGGRAGRWFRLGGAKDLSRVPRGVERRAVYHVSRSGVAKGR